MTRYSGTAERPNSMALVALILGLVSLLLSAVVLGGVLGLVAVIVGIIAVLRPGRKGMSIIGLVTGALAIPLSAVAGILWVAVLVPALGGARMDVAMRSRTMADMDIIKTSLMTFELDNGRLPTDREGLGALLTAPAGLAGKWRGPYLGKVPVDAWGNAYDYSTSLGGADFELISKGADGVLGTGDDIDKHTGRP